MESTVTDRDYTSVVDTDADPVLDKTVIRVDAHTESDGGRFPEYRAPQVTEESLTRIADALDELMTDPVVGVLRSKVEELRMSPDSTLHFQAKNLTNLVIFCTILRAQKRELDDLQLIGDLTEFGKAIYWSNDELLAASYQYTEIPKLRSEDEDDVHINPFRALAGEQDLTFVNKQGDAFDSAQ